MKLPFGIASGETATLSFPFTVEVTLPDSIPGSEVALYFDLLGFGDDDSAARIDNVRLAETQTLTINLILDPATDSGESATN